MMLIIDFYKQEIKRWEEFLKEEERSLEAIQWAQGVIELYQKDLRRLH